MIGVQPHFGPGDEVGLAFLVESMRVAEPLIVGTGVATAEEIGMETFEQRLRDEAQRTPGSSYFLHAAQRVGDNRPGVTLATGSPGQLLTRAAELARSEGLEPPTF